MLQAATRSSQPDQPPPLFTHARKKTERILATGADVIDVLVNELDALLDCALILAVQVGEVNLEPPQPLFAKRLALVED
jgi:hypothetical protein